MYYSLYGCLVCVLNVVFNSKAENVTINKMEFVDVLKQNLRRNNDDYAEIAIDKPTNKIRSTKIDYVKNKKNTSRDSINNVFNRVNRRAGEKNLWELDYNEIKTATSPDNQKSDNTGPDTIQPFKLINQFHHKKKNINKLNDSIQINLPKNKTVTKVSELINKRIDKFKKFMEKNSNLSKELIRSEPLTTKPELKSKDNVLRFDQRDFQRSMSNEERSLLGPDLLDMSPAKGGRIHRLRMKGRLCHRHVLLPEGPKYDSNGRWYLPEHRLVAKRLYNATSRPRLLLPRCCNCCKKSVLGCE